MEIFMKKRDWIELLIICVIVSVIGYYLGIDTSVMNVVACIVGFFYGMNASRRKYKEDNNKDI